MALQSIWMRENMLQSPNKKYGRRMTESEMRVQRSTEKLSVPDWYKKNSSRPPKILSNYTPIDQRPPSWKSLLLKKFPVTSTNIAPMGSSTVSHNGVLETEIGPSSSGNQSYQTYEINRITPKKESSLSSCRQESPTKNSNTKNIAPKSRLINSSQTFPRVSPSRKINNINIVFPQQLKESKCLMITDLDEPDTSVTDITRDSLDSTISTGINVTSNSQDELNNASLRERKLFQTPNCQIDRAKIYNPSTTYTEVKYQVSHANNIPEANNFELGVTMISDESPVSTVSGNAISSQPETKVHRRPLSELFPVCNWRNDATSEEKDREQTFESSYPIEITAIEASSGKENKKPSLISSIAISERGTTSQINKKKLPPPIKPRTKLSYDIIPKDDKKCELCKTRESIGFREKNFLPPILEKSHDPPSSLSSSSSSSRLSTNNAQDSSSVSILNSTKKSSELVKIIKSNQQPRSRKSLVSDIIDELNEKCKISSQPKPKALPRTRNFVKKLVMALENGDCSLSSRKTNDDCSVKNDCENFANLDYGSNENEIFSDKDVFVDSENYSEDDIGSAAISTSISYRGTDTSSSSSISSSNDPHIESSPIKHYRDMYNWNMNIDENKERTITIVNNNNDETRNKNYRDLAMISPILEKPDIDGLHWNKINLHNLPRTSSRLSINSGISSNRAGQTSTCKSSTDRSDVSRKSSLHRTGKFFTNGWGNTYKTNDEHYKRSGRCSNESTILDSGYSDGRSTIRSLGSSWIDDCTMTRLDCTAIARKSPEINTYYGELSRDLETSNRRRTKALIHGRPFVI